MLRTPRIRRYRIADPDAAHAHPTERATDPAIVCALSQDGSTTRNALRALALLALLAACGPAAEPAAPEIRPVRVVTVEERTGGETVSLTGTVQAETEVNLAFRIDGRMIERLVNVGDRSTRRPGRRAARSGRTRRTRCAPRAPTLAAAQGQLVEAREQLRAPAARCSQDGWTTRVRYDEARQTLETAQSRVGRRPGAAQHRREPAELYRAATPTPPAPSPRVGAEPGEVVQAGRMIVQVARQDGRDAVFDVPGAGQGQGARPTPRSRSSLTIEPDGARRSAACARSRRAPIRSPAPSRSGSG